MNRCAWGCHPYRRSYRIRIDAAVTVEAELCHKHLTALLRRKGVRRWRWWGWVTWKPCVIGSDRVTG